jgi:hypothetical protein
VLEARLVLTALAAARDAGVADHTAALDGSIRRGMILQRVNMCVSVRSDDVRQIAVIDSRVHRTDHRPVRGCVTGSAGAAVPLREGVEPGNGCTAGGSTAQQHERSNGYETSHRS